MDARIAHIIARMEDNLASATRVPDLAAAVQLSPSRFAHLFRDQTGVSPGRYLHRIRMHRARVLLERTFLSVREVMHLWGSAIRATSLATFGASTAFRPVPRAAPATRAPHPRRSSNTSSPSSDAPGRRSDRTRNLDEPARLPTRPSPDSQRTPVPTEKAGRVQSCARGRDM